MISPGGPRDCLFHYIHVIKSVNTTESQVFESSVPTLEKYALFSQNCGTAIFEVLDYIDSLGP